ncbi:MAG: hypothetical protein JW999_05085 [Methanotrichaceae archaeon]|nr:hypothetical protein [Methanotrichaceae archaeon]
MKMKYIAIFLCLVGLVLAQGYNDWQQGAAEGLKVGFKMGQAFEQQAQNVISVASFNAQVDEYNAWVREKFGEDPNLLMSKLNAPVDLSKPVLIANNTTQGGIIHAIDGMNKANEGTYTTNDMNLLPASAIANLEEGGEYLGGV